MADLDLDAICEIDNEDEMLEQVPTLIAELREARRERDELAEALGEIRAISADRESFVLLGPRAFIAAEQICIEALERYRTARKETRRE